MTEPRIARRGLVCLAALALVMIAAPPVLAQTTAPGPAASWEPGVLLVKLRPGAPNHERGMLDRLGLREVDQLPLVPDLFEVRVPPGNGVLTEERKLDRQPEVLYAQPNYDETETPDTGPSDPAYWPTDPLFWPTTFTPPQGCPEPNLAGQWPLWQLGHNLTDSSDPANKFNPLASGRADVNGGLPRYQQYNSINVLPVWNLLIAEGRLPAPDIQSSKNPHPFWRTEDIQRYGIAVQDTGLSNAPDITPQIAALFSTVTSTETVNGKDDTLDRVREVYRDDPNRDDLTAVKAGFKQSALLSQRTTSFEWTRRDLFALDDADLLQGGHLADPGMPTGCDGHGTGVAAVADATAYNGQGVAGVAYDAPLIGLRPGEPWDSPDLSTLATDRNIPKARMASKSWWEFDATSTDVNEIEQFEIVKALRVPVLNMSYGEPLFNNASDKPPVVADPVLFDALLRTLATGNTLGVTAAGNDVEQYGSGHVNPGTGERAPKAPCGINLLRSSDARVSPNGRTFDDAAFPGPRSRGEADWGDVNLLCVAATTSYSSRLWSQSGRGDSAVDLAAPGQDITTLARPVFSNGTASPAYQVESGTSLAAPMVAGAAALLREAAPKAPIAEIARALRNGARRYPSFYGLVRYGSLDVACALSKLSQRAKPGWDLVSLDDPNFTKATQDCGGRPTYVAETELARDTNYLRKKGETTLSALVKAKNLAPPPSNSFRWQDTLLGRQDAQRIVFTAGGTGVKPADDRVYDAGTAIVGCTEPGFAITAVRVEVSGGPSRLWYFPTDGQAKRNTIEVALALAAPLPKTANLTVDLLAYCDQFPSTPG